MSVRIGLGYDIHRMAKGRPLILGGIEIPFKRGLLGLRVYLAIMPDDKSVTVGAYPSLRHHRI